MSAEAAIDDNLVDAAADETIFECLNPAAPKSFFLYAGAGSGKTRSLVRALDFIKANHSEALWLRGRQVGVITYTNAACDEIRSRIEHDPLVVVSTIHSFLWSLIGGYNRDIREWLRINLQREIETLEDAQRRGRVSKASETRARSIISKTDRLARLDEIRVFSYSPEGENRGRGSLNHAEVISMGTTFITEKQTLGRLLVNKFPVLLVDESQDTNKHLIDALFKLQAARPDEFCLGLFGDTMQRIYADGKVGLSDLIPPTWATPIKKMNHRCPKRVVSLINQIRSQDDQQVQQHRQDRAGGFARLFIVPQGKDNKGAIERAIALRMSAITVDPQWENPAGVKTLALEHLMSARRLGFVELFAPLNKVDSFKTGLLAGTNPGLRLFTHDVLPLVTARQSGDEFAVAALLRKRSPLLHTAILKAAGENQIEHLKRVREGMNSLAALWENSADPTLRAVLLVVGNSGLLEIPELLKAFVEPPELENPIMAELARLLLAEQQEEADLGEESEEEQEANAAIQAWDSCLDAPMTQVPLYLDYVTGKSPFDTHQGVKGLEFPRVMVVVDDEEAGGFMFSYDKLFEVKQKSQRDLDHERAGEETTVDRTRRLFYVTCSRAEESLAVVVYSSNPIAARQNSINAGWFAADEIEMID